MSEGRPIAVAGATKAAFSGALQGKAARKGLIALAALATGLAAFMLARALMILVAPQTVWEPPLPVMASAAPATIARTDFDPSLDIFHRGFEAAETNPAALGEDAPETTLNLTLRGLRAGPDGVAYIQTPDRVTKNYYLEDEIVSNVSLEAVHPGYVVIRRNGALERLTLEDEETFTRPAPTPVSAPAPTPVSASRPLQPERPAAAGGSVSPADFFQSVSLDRATEGGELVGFSVRARDGSARDMLASAGMREGDVITAVNGRKAGRGLDLASLMSELQSRPAASLLVKRGDNVVTVRLVGRN